MMLQIIRGRRRQVLIDVSTQKDLFLAEGSACIRNHRRVLANIRRVTAWARHKNMPVISTCEVYPPNGNGGSAGYCVDGTEGQKKIQYTLLNNRVSFPADGSNYLPVDVLRRYRQIILHKRCTDPFGEPRIERLLSEVRAHEFILIGACAESTVKAMALGLLHRGKKVTVVTDAVGSHDSREADLAFRKMQTKVAKLIETKKFAGNSHLRYVGVCSCQMCHGRAKKITMKVGAESTN